jgi:hypothetical protein
VTGFPRDQGHFTALDFVAREIFLRKAIDLFSRPDMLTLPLAKWLAGN